MRGHSEIGANGGMEAGSWREGLAQANLLEPVEVVAEVFCGDAAPGAQEGLEPFVAATVWMWSSPRVRSPADRFSASWLTPRSRAQRG
jgi:hypothetical protein